MKISNLIAYLILCSILINCSPGKNILGVYKNHCYFTESPKSILKINKHNYSMIYPSVIGEKEEGIWEYRNDTIFLYQKTEIINDLKDTLKVDKEAIILIKKKNKLYNLKVNECYLEK